MSKEVKNKNRKGMVEDEGNVELKKGKKKEEKNGVKKAEEVKVKVKEEKE